MSQEIIKVFDYIGEKLGIAIDWTQENVMPYLEDLVGRFVKLNIIEDIIGIVCWGLIVIGCIVGAIILLNGYRKIQSATDEISTMYWKSWKRIDGSMRWDMTPFGSATMFISIVGLVFGVPFLGVCISELIKWIYIPEFQIAEEVSYILQGM